MKVDVTALVDHNLIKMHTVPLYKPEFHNTPLSNYFHIERL